MNTEILSRRELSLIQVCSLHQATGKLCPCFTVHPLSDPSVCSSELSELRLLFSCGGGGCSQPALQKGVGAEAGLLPRPHPAPTPSGLSLVGFKRDPG